MPPWVTFDMDNTLIKNPYWQLHFRPWLECQSAIRGEDYLHLWHQFRREGEARWRRGHWIASFDWSDIAETLNFSPLPDPPRPNLSDLSNLILPGVPHMVRELRKMDIRLGVVTNGLVRFQMPYLRALGWDFLFDAIVGPDVAGFAKPHQGILTPLSPGIAHIGDRLTHDVLVAHRAGRLGILVGVPTPESDRIDPLCPAQITPDYIINDYYALAPLIRHLRESWFPPGG